MEGLNRAVAGIPRKLSEGECVEVRQKEVGLRGSWHPGIVVKVKYGRRVVEYDDLFTLDGSKKLRESIPLFKDIKLPSSVLREKNGTVAEPNKRGFIRPRPPSCLVPSPQNWKRGLLVDGFYDGAWWEGILLDNVIFGYDEAKVKVFFPEEGDELRIFVKDIRVSQEWDEASGQWAVRGYWSFDSGNGRIDLGPLKQMCMKPRSYLKELWRQKRFSGSQDSPVEKQKISYPSFTLAIRNQLDMSGGDCQNAVQENTPLSHKDTSDVLSNGVARSLSKFQLPLVRILQISGHPISAQAHAFLEEGQLVVNGEHYQKTLLQKELDQSTSVTTGLKSECDFLSSTLTSGVGQKVSPGPGYKLTGPGYKLTCPGYNLTGCTPESFGKQADALASLSWTPLLGAKGSGTLGLELSGQSLFQKSKGRKSDARRNLKHRFTGKDRASSRITRSKFALEKQRNGKHPLSRSSKFHGQDLQQSTVRDKLLEEGKLLPTSLDGKLPKLDLRHMILHAAIEGHAMKISSDGKQAETRSGSPLLSECRPCHQGSLEVWENRSTGMQDSDFRDNGAISPEHPNIRMRQARLAAKKFLLDAGWKIDARTRSRGLTLKQEAVYVSPSGSRFFSLAAACRGWKACKNSANFFGEGINKEIKLLNAYSMAEGFRCLRKPYTRQAKAEQMILSDGSTKTKTDVAPMSMAEARDTENSSNSVDIPKDGTGTLQQKVELAISSSKPATVHTKRSKLTPEAEKSKKRKSEGHGGILPAEPRRKRGRPPLKKGSTSPLQESNGYRGRGGCRMQVLLSFPEREKDSNSSQDIGESSHFKKSTVLSWLIDKGILKENESVCYVNRKDGHVMKKGQVTREGVICDCCKDVFTLSNFEAHAGSKLHRPSANIFLDDGRSISDCQLEACALQDAKEKKEGLMDISDDTCGVCGDGGELVLCDHCPSTFHADCIGLEVIPEGDWYCPRCSCSICGSNQLACGVDNTMLRCVQCELEFHLTCVPAHIMLTPNQATQKTWFCDRQCEEIFTGLRRLVGIANPMEKGFSWMLLRSMKKDQGLSPSSLEVMAEHHSKLSVAHGVMQECFVPMIDPRTKINLVSQALYNRRSKVTRLNYCGFYTMILERGDEIISVATIRVHGASFAEMPLVGTRYQYRRQGMCRRLMHALEEMLKNIGVEKLILPAVPELLETWIGAFNFQHMSLPETRELTKLSLMTFPGTTLLQKRWPSAAPVSRPVCQPLTSDGVDNLDSPCKSVQEFFTMARASLDSGFLESREACFKGGTMGRDIPLMDPSGQNLCSNSDTFNHVQESIQPFFADDPHTPPTVLAFEGHLDMSSKGGRLKNRVRCKAQVESSGDAKEREDDDIYTRVVIATTRSNRLVKSTRWVADGLKELKDAKQSKRTLHMEGNLHKMPCSETAQELKCGHLLENFAQNDDGQENGQIMENVYVRTRRKAAPMSVEVAEGNATQEVPGFSARESMNNPVVEFLHLGYGKHYNLTLEIMNAKRLSSLSAENMSGMSIWDEHLKANSCLRDGFNGNNSASDAIKDGQSSSGEATNKLLICSKFYTRRKKEDSRQEGLKMDTPGKGSAGQTVGPFSPEQTVSSRISDIKQDLGTFFISHVGPSLVPGAVDRQGCNPESSLEK